MDRLLLVLLLTFLVACGSNRQPSQTTGPDTLDAGAGMVDAPSSAGGAAGGAGGALGGATGGAVQTFTPTVTLLDSGRVLVVGGFIAEEYDPSSASFSLTATPFQTKTGHTATLLGNGKVLLAGGSPMASALAELYVVL